VPPETDAVGGLGPAFARQLGRVIQVAALPAETIAQADDGHAQLLEHPVFAKARAGHLHELKDLHRLAATMGTQGQAKGRRALALAVAGVHDQQAAAITRRFGLVCSRWVA
jgi:hypothetical protein